MSNAAALLRPPFKGPLCAGQALPVRYPALDRVVTIHTQALTAVCLQAPGFGICPEVLLSEDLSLRDRLFVSGCAADDHAKVLIHGCLC